MLGSTLGRLTRWQLELAARAGARLLHEQRRLLSRASHWPNVVRAAADTRVGSTPYEVVFRTGTLTLLRYRRATPATQPKPLLCCYALINRPYILDLLPGKSVVQRYLDQGFEVFMIDWGVPSHADRGLTLHDYVSGLLDAVVERVLAEQRCQSLHLLGYCMGGTLSALFTALRPRAVATLTLLAAPIGFGGRESLLNVWADARHFDVDAFIDRYGNCPGWFLQLCFLYTKPVENLIQKNITFFEQLEDPRFVSNFFAMERWTNDNIPVAGATFREFVKHLYQQDQLVRGQLQLGGQRVDLARVDCPLLLLTARNDHLVPPASTLAIRDQVSSRSVRELMIDAGHVGLVVSSKAHQTLWPEATRWLVEHGAGPEPRRANRNLS